MGNPNFRVPTLEVLSTGRPVAVLSSEGSFGVGEVGLAFHFPQFPDHDNILKSSIISSLTEGLHCSLHSVLT